PYHLHVYRIQKEKERARMFRAVLRVLQILDWSERVMTEAEYEDIFERQFHMSLSSKDAIVSTPSHNNASDDHSHTNSSPDSHLLARMSCESQLFGYLSNEQFDALGSKARYDLSKQYPKYAYINWAANTVFRVPKLLEARPHADRATSLVDRIR